MLRQSKLLALICIAAFFYSTLLGIAAQPEGYTGKLNPGTKIFGFVDTRYMVPEVFPEFINWPPVMMGALAIDGSHAIYIFETLNPEGTVALLVATYVDREQTLLLAVQAFYMPKGVPPEKWVTDYYIETGLFKNGKPSFVMISATEIPKLTDFIENM